MLRCSEGIAIPMLVGIIAKKFARVKNVARRTKKFSELTRDFG
jgi:hypothetical protein